MNHREYFWIMLAVALGACASTKNTKNVQTPTKRQPPKVRKDMWEIRDTELFVRDVGPEVAPVVVVLHGGPGGNHRSQRQLEQLAPDYRVVLYDQRGTGESDRFDVSPKDPKSLERLSLKQNVEDIEAIRERLGRDKISIIGHSWGAALAVFYAAAYPQHIEKLIVYSGGPETRELSKLKRAAHQKMLTEQERALFKKRSAKLAEAVKKGAAQEELDRLFGELATVMFSSLYCKRPEKSGDDADANVGRAGFWANQAAGAYVENFEYASIADKLRQVKAPVLLTWGVCEPSPKARLTNLLDFFPDAQFVIFDQSGHNAMEEQTELFFETLRAFLAGKPLPLASYRSRDALTDALMSKRKTQLEKWGERLTYWLYEGQFDKITPLFSEKMRQVFPGQKFETVARQLMDKLGDERQLIRKAHSYLPSGGLYRRIVRFAKSGFKQLELRWTLGDIDRQEPSVTGFSVTELKPPAPTRRLRYKPKTAMSLPVSGEWFVLWGGLTQAQNYHITARDQRFAYDFSVVIDGDTHQSDGTKNEHYYCFGKPIFAAGKGKVVVAEDGNEDRAPGTLVTDAKPLGNYVIIEHGNREYSFYGHLKNGSVKVKKGDRVSSGQQIGQCGNSGRTTEPHLHFHIQDTARPFRGYGIPPRFPGEPVQGDRLRAPTRPEK